MTQAHRLAAALVIALTGAAVAPSMVFAQPSDEILPDDPELVPPKTNDPTERAKAFYTRGRKNYDLGRFKRAIALYTRAYEELPDAAFLFNIAQGYRQLDDCRQALFFYKRFMSVAKDVNAETRKEIDGHITVLSDCVKKQEDIRNRPPGGTLPPGGGTGSPGGDTGGGGTETGGGGNETGGGGTETGGGGTETGGGGGGRVGDTGGGAGGGGGDIDDGGDDGGEEPTTTSQPKLLALFARGGGARFAAGSLTPTFVAAAGFTAGYPIAVGPKVKLDLGGAFGFMPVPWNGAGGMSGTSSLITAGAHVGATYEVAPKIGVRGELDVGALMFTGLGEGNPFTDGGMAATGALTMLSVRAGLAAEYSFNQQLSLLVTPVAFTYSPAHEGFTDEVDAITRIEFLAGLGYRM